ncbi:MAG: sulfatase-like hydrolase/transferase, partial [Lysobacterales bacterium]
MSAAAKTLLRLFVLLVLAPGAPALLGADDPPNVLLIIADDLNGYGFFDGYPGTLTPALDELKALSVVFEHAYAAAPLGEASRAAFFSGIYPHRSGAYRNGADSWDEVFSAFESMPERFRREGYTTFGAGRVPDIDKSDAWDEAVSDGGHEPFPAQGDLLAGGGDRFWGVQPWTGPDSDFPDTVNADALIEFLQESSDQPFFAVYGLWRPHAPFTAPRRFFDQYDVEALEPPPGYREGDVYDIPDGAHRLLTVRSSRWLRSGKFHPDKWRRVLHGYLAATSFADWNIGRVLAALEESRHAANTIVVFWSDNGLHLGEKNHFGKATLWEPALRTPAAIRLPGNVNNGRVVAQPVS